MINNIIKVGVIFAALAISLLSAVSAMDSVTVDINAAAVIQNPENRSEVRLILRFDLPEMLDTNSYVTIAELRFNVVPVHEVEHPIIFCINPLSREWSMENVNWDTPWQCAGGDYIDSIEVAGFVPVDFTEGLRLDISNLIHGMINAYFPNYGLILYQQGPAFDQINVRRFDDDNSLVQLVIYYLQSAPDRE